MTEPWPCYVCGQDVPRPKFGVHAYDGGGSFVMRDDNEDQLDIDPAGDLGLHPVGSDCVRKLRKQGVKIYNWSD